VKIINRVPDRFSSRFLENLVRWVGEEVGLPDWWFDGLSAKFKYLPPKSRSQFRGLSTENPRKILVSISQRAEVFPFYEISDGVPVEYANIVDAFVAITAHEMYHQYQDYAGVDYCISKEEEASACRMEVIILAKLYVNRAGILQGLGYHDSGASLKDVEVCNLYDYLIDNLMYLSHMTVRDLLKLVDQRG